MMKCALAVVLLTFTMVGRGQDHAGRLTFDVASIRLSKPDTQGGIKALPGGNGYTAHNVSVRLMISLMYRVPMRQIKGGPEWLTSDTYDVEARADHAYNLDDLHTMFQNLLADRFGLKFHMESKEGPVYVLELGKGGTKMKVNESAQDYNIPVSFRETGVVVGKRVPMPYFCWFLGQLLQRDRPVIDRTGLTGNYDFELSFLPDLAPETPRESLPPELLNRPSIFDALDEQLGLKLTPEKGPVGYLVIDSVQRPADN